MNAITLSIANDGTVKAIYDDELAEFCEQGKARILRASHVEPTDDGQWMADMAPVNGPLLGPYRLRAEALAAEHEWLEAKMFSSQKGAVSC